jgi:hypothetical protein
MRHKSKLFGLFVVTLGIFGFGIYYIETLDKIKVSPTVSGKELLEKIKRY